MQTSEFRVFQRYLKSKPIPLRQFPRYWAQHKKKLAECDKNAEHDMDAEQEDADSSHAVYNKDVELPNREKREQSITSIDHIGDDYLVRAGFVKDLGLATGLYSDTKFTRSKALENVETTEDVSWQRLGSQFDGSDDAELVLFGKDYCDVSCENIRQGALGDCWFMSAVASIVNIDRSRIINLFDIPWCSPKLGLYTVLLYIDGKERSLIVDDSVPFRETTPAHGWLPTLFAQVRDKGGIWLAILEKACAKARGSYGNLEGGHSLCAFLFLTRGFPQKNSLERPPYGDKVNFVTSEDFNFLPDRCGLALARVAAPKKTTIFDEWQHVRCQSKPRNWAGLFARICDFGSQGYQGRQKEIVSCF